MNNLVFKILKNNYFNNDLFSITELNIGLINKTWVIQELNKNDSFIFQQINIDIFKNPNAIAKNIHLLNEYLVQNKINYSLISSIKTFSGTEYATDGVNYFRLFPFIKNSNSKTVLQSPNHAFEAAAQFGKFTATFKNFDVNQLQTILPNFHHLSLRYQQFENALLNGNSKRIKECKNEIEYLKNQVYMVKIFEDILNNTNFKKRVTHHDAKISNVLFNKDDKANYVIDLDTVMPGYFLSDVGDMMRTYICPVTEEESDFTKIIIRKEYVDAIINGYNLFMHDELTNIEKQHFIYAGKMMIYMQALRFLTDYILNDIYYGAKYPKHNFVRAGNQINLLQKLILFENE